MIEFDERYAHQIKGIKSTPNEGEANKLLQNGYQLVAIMEMMDDEGGPLFILIRRGK